MPGNCPASLRPTAALPVENIPLQAERHSGRGQKLFAFPPESRSPSDRNAVRIHNGMMFGFRTESRSPSTGFPRLFALEVIRYTIPHFSQIMPIEIGMVQSSNGVDALPFLATW